MKTNKKYRVGYRLDFKRNPYKGKLFAIEGIDGSGKTTQARELRKVLKKKGNNIIFTKNPTDSQIGKLIRKILAGKGEFNPVAFQYLFVADRAFQQKEFEENLKKGKMIITDRYFWSSVAYGAEDRGVKFKKNGDILLSAFGILSTYYQFLVPDITFYLKISPNAALKRIAADRHSKDIYDQRKKLQNIAAGYEWLVKKFSKEFVIIDGEQSVEKVTRDILKHL